MLITKTMLLRIIPNRMLQLFGLLLASIQPGDEVDAKFWAIKKVDDKTFVLYLSDDVKNRTLDHSIDYEELEGT